jgi:L-ascorbate metabolism protein UlaG (beta-lactamase superfamily)
MGGVEPRAAVLFLGRYRIFRRLQGSGAYLPPEIMKAVHLTPEEAVQVFIDLNARAILGIHWGTFDLAEGAARRAAATHAG